MPSTHVQAIPASSPLTCGRENPCPVAQTTGLTRAWCQTGSDPDHALEGAVHTNPIPSLNLHPVPSPSLRPSPSPSLSPNPIPIPNALATILILTPTLLAQVLGRPQRAWLDATLDAVQEAPVKLIVSGSVVFGSPLSNDTVGPCSGEHAAHIAQPAACVVQ